MTRSVLGRGGGADPVVIAGEGTDIAAKLLSALDSKCVEGCQPMPFPDELWIAEMRL